MPKKDNFSAQVKGADKARKKLNEDKKKEEKAKVYESREEAEAAVAGFKKKGGEAERSAFAKAAAAEAYVEDEQEVAEDDDYEPESPSAVASTGSSAPSKAKKEAPKKLSKKDEFALLAEQEKLAKRERIKERFLRFLVVGVIMDFFKGDSNGTNGSHAKKNGSKDSTKKKGKSNGDSDFSTKSMKDNLSAFGNLIVPLAITLAVLYGKAMEDTYAGGRIEETNFYDVMGLDRDASVMDVRKKYKALALTWHPDKNPDCKECPEKFAAISKAYETLSNPESKKTYDSKRATTETLSSMNSIDLTAEDFERKVLRSNDVWIVEVYDPNDGASPSFHPLWEETASSMKNVARFGRIDIGTHRNAMNLLPIRVKITPSVFRFARGETPEHWVPSGRDVDDGASGIKRFVTDSYPGLQKLEGPSEVANWWKRSGRSRLLISGNGGVIARGAQNKQFLPVMRETHLWSGFFEVAAADTKDISEGLKTLDVTVPAPDKTKKKGHTWAVMYVPAGDIKEKVQVHNADDVKSVPESVEAVVYSALGKEAPLLTVRNHGQICGAGAASRTFCLILVDMPDRAEVTKVLEELARSREEYNKELAEQQESGEDGTTEEPFNIQAVRVMTGSSRIPGQPFGPDGEFYTAWNEVGRSQMFVVEMETQRVAPVKASILSHLCQSIAYEDLKLKELPEGISLVRSLPDPEVPLQRVIFRKLTHPVGALFAWVLLAAVMAIGPELALPVQLAAGGGGVVLILAVWPLACRRLLALVLGGV